MSDEFEKFAAEMWKAHAHYELRAAARHAEYMASLQDLLDFAQGMAAATAGETGTGSTEGNSPVGEADAPKEPHP